MAQQLGTFVVLIKDLRLVSSNHVVALSYSVAPVSGILIPSLTPWALGKNVVHIHT